MELKLGLNLEQVTRLRNQFGRNELAPEPGMSSIYAHTSNEHHWFSIHLSFGREALRYSSY